MRLTKTTALHQPRLTWFILRREPLYHKLQYAKVPKYDAAAAILGVVVGAFVVYLALSSVASGSADLTDLTVLVWYMGLWAANLILVGSLQRTAAWVTCRYSLRLWYLFSLEFLVL